MTSIPGRTCPFDVQHNIEAKLYKVPGCFFQSVYNQKKSGSMWLPRHLVTQSGELFFSTSLVVVHLRCIQIMITGESPAVQMVILLQEPLVQHTPWYQSSSGIHHPQGSDSSDTYGDIYIHVHINVHVHTHIIYIYILYNYIHIIYILYTYYIHIIYIVYTYYIHIIHSGHCIRRCLCVYVRMSLI